MVVAWVRKKAHMRAFLLLLLTSFLLPGVDCGVEDFFTISLQVDPKKQECLHMDIAKGSEVEALVMVFRGGKLDVEFSVQAPSGASLYKQLVFSNLDKAGKALPTIVKKGPKFTAGEEGAYTFCFDNRIAKWTAKVLTFDLSVRPFAGAGGEGAEVVKAPAAGSGGLLPEAALTTAEDSQRSALQHLDGLRKFARNYLDRLLQVEQDLHYHRQRSARHHATLLSTEWRLTTSTVLETLVLVVVAVFQVWFVRKWFSDETASPSSPGMHGFGSFSSLPSARDALSAAAGSSLGSARTRV